MDSTTLTTEFFSEYALLAAALAETGPDAPVPTCPGWTAADLSWHVTEVYLHKVGCIQTLDYPSPWPPARDSVSLADAFSQITGEFATHAPSDRAKTFVEHDQTVGFWVRRMAQETVIHRVDAELTAGMPVSPIGDDLAVDGIDEMLEIFLAYGSVTWPEEFADVLATADRRPVRLRTTGGDWRVVAAPDRIAVTPAGGAADAGATVSGTPGDLLRWVWNRGVDGITIDGDDALVKQLQALIVIAAQ